MPDCFMLILNNKCDNLVCEQTPIHAAVTKGKLCSLTGGSSLFKFVVSFGLQLGFIFSRPVLGCVLKSWKKIKQLYRSSCCLHKKLIKFIS
ncbi:hypothetical protein ACET3Z_007619 [Daucus carota]